MIKEVDQSNAYFLEDVVERKREPNAKRNVGGEFCMPRQLRIAMNILMQLVGYAYIRK